ncbi:hypothetical protein EXIGLDRAFT_775172 [Exidia glandulosa HHB12029]|uniref:Uncharacterized protein n=1 Tax=Exidia glandulosa HHB12029 TaxID=1314781 RepID=A0A165E125_EXIGL|nr:hypothetical protein EXIGLDRAFT_775172 [Exidia glandulosa HHB12029]
MGSIAVVVTVHIAVNAKHLQGNDKLDVSVVVQDPTSQSCFLDDLATWAHTRSIAYRKATAGSRLHGSVSLLERPGCVLELLCPSVLSSATAADRKRDGTLRRRLECAVARSRVPYFGASAVTKFSIGRRVS